MHIPLWQLVLALLCALCWREISMAALMMNRAVPTSSRALLDIKAALFHSRPGQSLLRPTSSTITSTSLQQKQSSSFISRQTSSFSTSTPPPPSRSNNNSKMGSQQFLEAVKGRRSVYPLKKESTISDAQIQEIISQAVLNVPSSFNSQTTRVVLLLKEEHEKLWDITKDVLKGIVPEEAFAPTEQKLNMFKGAYGTVLFFDHRPSISAMQEKFAAYADKFPGWATQSNGMHQFVVWTALEAEGLGANLQHYNPLIDQRVASTWGIDKDWELNAQLVFGTPVAPAGEKTFKDVGERFKVFGA